MKNYFYIKKTKMIDEATLGHKYTPMFMAIAFFILVYYASSLACAIIQSIPLVIYIMSSKEMSIIINSEQPMESAIEYLEHFSPPDWFMAVDLISRVAIIIIAILFCKLFEKRGITSLGIRRDGAVIEYLLGLVIGFFMFGLVVLLSFSTNSIEIAINPKGVSAILILYLVGFIIQGAAEEIIVRGYFMVSLARDYKVFVAIIVSSLAFALIHIFNEGMTIIAFINILLIGIFFAVYIFKRGSIWGACAIHSMWNFAQGNVFGISVSGMDTMPSILTVTQNTSRGMWLLNGGAFGLEGSLLATIVIIVSIALVLLLPTKKSEISATEEGYVPTQRKNKKLWEPF